MKDDNSLAQKAGRAWLEAGEALGIRVQAPYEIDDPSVFAIAFLPHFGSENGVLVDGIEAPEFRGDRRIREYALDRRIFYSALNLAQYETFRRTHFADTLKDWGFFGAERPDWLDETR